VFQVHIYATHLASGDLNLGIVITKYPNADD
jgi:hypothetical protein